MCGRSHCRACRSLGWRGTGWSRQGTRVRSNPSATETLLMRSTLSDRPGRDHDIARRLEVEASGVERQGEGPIRWFGRSVKDVHCAFCSMQPATRALQRLAWVFGFRSSCCCSACCRCSLCSAFATLSHCRYSVAVATSSGRRASRQGANQIIRRFDVARSIDHFQERPSLCAVQQSESWRG